MAKTTGFEDILKALEEEGEKEKKRILREAKAEARRILKEAKTVASKEYRKELEDRISKAEAAARKILTEAEIERDRILTDIKLEFLKKTFSKALNYITSIRGTERYKDAMKRLLEEALTQIGSAKLKEIDEETLADLIYKASKHLKISYQAAREIAKNLLSEKEYKKDELTRFLEMIVSKATISPKVFCNPEDEDLVSKIASEIGFKPVIVPDKRIQAGLKVSSADGRISVNNTIEARIRKLSQFFSKELVELIFK